MELTQWGENPSVFIHFPETCHFLAGAGGRRWKSGATESPLGYWEASESLALAFEAKSGSGGGSGVGDDNDPEGKPIPWEIWLGNWELQ